MYRDRSLGMHPSFCTLRLTQATSIARLGHRHYLMAFPICQRDVVNQLFNDSQVWGRLIK